MQAVLGIEDELGDLRLSDHPGFLGEHVADRSGHRKARVRLVVHPNPERPELLARLGRCYGMYTLYSLDDKCLRVGIVDLAIIVVQNTLSLVWEVWLVVPGLGHDDQGVVPHASTLTSVYERCLFVIGLADHDSSRVSSVAKDESILFAVAGDKGAAAELTVELRLLLQLTLDAQESRDHGFLYILEKGSARVALPVGVVFAGVVALVLPLPELIMGLFWLLGSLDGFLVVLEVLGHVLGDVLRDKVAVGAMAVSHCHEPFFLALR